MRFVQVVLSLAVMLLARPALAEIENWKIAGGTSDVEIYVLHHAPGKWNRRSPSIMLTPLGRSAQSI